MSSSLSLLLLHFSLSSVLFVFSPFHFFPLPPISVLLFFFIALVFSALCFLFFPFISSLYRICFLVFLSSSESSTLSFLLLFFPLLFLFSLCFLSFPSFFSAYQSRRLVLSSLSRVFYFVHSIPSFSIVFPIFCALSSSLFVLSIPLLSSCYLSPYSVFYFVSSIPMPVLSFVCVSFPSILFASLLAFLLAFYSLPSAFN